MAVHDAVPSALGKAGNDKHCRVPEGTAEGSATLTLKDSKSARQAGGPHPTPGTRQPGPRKARAGPGGTLRATASLAAHGSTRRRGIYYSSCIRMDSGVCRVTPGHAV